MKRIGIVAACCMVFGCADSVDRAAQNAYNLTLRSPSDGSGYSIRRDASGRVATWQIRIDDTWDAYASWVRPRLGRDFDDVTATPNQALMFSKGSGVGLVLSVCRWYGPRIFKIFPPGVPRV